MRFLLLLLFLAAACQMDNSPQHTQDELKQTMKTFLYKSIKNDSAHVKYDVQDVAYFEDKDVYRCEFKVRMMVAGDKDTTGTMTADITKDFKTVKRKS